MFIKLVFILLFSLSIVSQSLDTTHCDPITTLNYSDIKPLYGTEAHNSGQVMWSSDSSYLFTLENGFVNQYNIQDFELVRSVSIQDGAYLRALDVSIDSNLLTTGVQDLRLVNLETNEVEVVTTFDNEIAGVLEDVALNANEDRLAAITGSSILRVFNLSTNSVEFETQSTFREDGIGKKVFFGTDGAQIIYGMSRGARIIDAESFETLFDYRFDSPLNLHDMDLGQDGQLVGIVGKDLTGNFSAVVFLNVPTFQEEKIIYTNTGAISIDFSPDNQFLAIGDSQGWKLWDIRRGLPQDFVQPTYQVATDNLGVPDIEFSPDMRFIATLSQTAPLEYTQDSVDTITIWGVCY